MQAHMQMCNHTVTLLKAPYVNEHAHAGDMQYHMHMHAYKKATYLTLNTTHILTRKHLHACTINHTCMHART